MRASALLCTVLLACGPEDSPIPNGDEACIEQGFLGR